MRNYVCFYSASLLVIEHLGDLAIDGKTTVILQSLRSKDVLKWYRIGCSDKLLYGDKPLGFTRLQNVLKSWVTISVSRKTLCHGVNLSLSIGMLCWTVSPTELWMIFLLCDCLYVLPCDSRYSLSTVTNSVLFCTVLSCLVHCPVMSCPVLSCPVLSTVLSCPVLSCSVLFRSVVILTAS